MMFQQSRRNHTNPHILVLFLYVFISASNKDTARGVLGVEERAVRNAVNMWRKGEASGQNIPIEHLLRAKVKSTACLTAAPGVEEYSPNVTQTSHGHNVTISNGFSKQNRPL